MRPAKEQNLLNSIHKGVNVQKSRKSKKEKVKNTIKSETKSEAEEYRIFLRKKMSIRLRDENI